MPVLFVMFILRDFFDQALAKTKIVLLLCSVKLSKSVHN